MDVPFGDRGRENKILHIDRIIPKTEILSQFWRDFDSRRN